MPITPDRVHQLIVPTFPDAGTVNYGEVTSLPAGLITVSLEAKFVYISGGTSVDCYVQTSLDGGESWIDVAQFTFATASAKKVSAISRARAATAAQTPSDQALGADTVVDGVLGDRLRAVVVAVGTYGAGTKIGVTAVVAVSGGG